jgi:hypothetical protein
MYGAQDIDELGEEPAEPVLAMAALDHLVKGLVDRQGERACNLSDALGISDLSGLHKTALLMELGKKDDFRSLLVGLWRMSSQDNHLMSIIAIRSTIESSRLSSANKP